jgi:hypothetical protein
MFLQHYWIIVIERARIEQQIRKNLEKILLFFKNKGLLGILAEKITDYITSIVPNITSIR